MEDLFSVARWVWCQDAPNNAYVLFERTVVLPARGTPVRVRITASYHYELYIDGTFVGRGPVHGDPQWCQVDEWGYVPAPDAASVQVTVLVHHAQGTHLHYLLPAPGGLRAEITTGASRVGTDEGWRCLVLPMWAQNVPARGWALDYCEDYDARLEPMGWQEKRFDSEVTAMWPCATVVQDADRIWGGYQMRLTPPLQRTFRAPNRFWTYRAPGTGALYVGEVSQRADEEDLIPVHAPAPFDLEAVNGSLAEANALTFDLGRECVGFYVFEIDAPAGVTIEVSGAELLQESPTGDETALQRPWVFRKNTRYSLRYRTGEGRQRFVSFSWSGFRYLHLVVRGDAQRIRISQVGCLERRAPLAVRDMVQIDDPDLRRIFDLCRYTLEAGAQEHLIDCPTREQTQYWGDGLYIAESLWRGFGERSYLEWYLEGFLHVPFREDGQISCTYPGQHQALLGYSLVPVLGQPFYRRQTGAYYRAAETYAKAKRLKVWYDELVGNDGLVTFDYSAYAERGLRNFIDHPGIGWHNFPHPGIEREGTSCPLNLFFYAFVRTLGELATDLELEDAGALAMQADGLAQSIRRTFYDGHVFHDAVLDGVLSGGTSWQTNALGVCFGLITGEEATCAMQAMLEGYDRLCRCSPYFHFYFLPALRRAGLEREAIALIKREWGAMLERDATTTWESFAGDALDSLCHPWSTAPFLFLLDSLL